MQMWAWVVIAAIVGVTIYLMARTISKVKRWKGEFLEEVAVTLAALEPSQRERVARTLLLAAWREGYPREIRDVIERNAGASMEEVWAEYGL